MNTYYESRAPLERCSSCLRGHVGCEFGGCLVAVGSFDLRKGESLESSYEKKKTFKRQPVCHKTIIYLSIYLEGKKKNVLCVRSTPPGHDVSRNKCVLRRAVASRKGLDSTQGKAPPMPPFSNQLAQSQTHFPIFHVAISSHCARNKTSSHLYRHQPAF